MTSVFFYIQHKQRPLSSKVVSEINPVKNWTNIPYLCKYFECIFNQKAIILRYYRYVIIEDLCYSNDYILAFNFPSTCIFDFYDDKKKIESNQSKFWILNYPNFLTIVNKIFQIELKRTQYFYFYTCTIWYIEILHHLKVFS